MVWGAEDHFFSLRRPVTLQCAASCHFAPVPSSLCGGWDYFERGTRTRVEDGTLDTRVLFCHSCSQRLEVPIERQVRDATDLPVPTKTTVETSEASQAQLSLLLDLSEVVPGRNSYPNSTL